MKLASPGSRAALFVAAVMTAGLAAGPALAQSKIAVIEVERLLQESARGQVAVQDLTRLRDEKQSELTSRQEQLAALQKQYNDGRLTLAEDRLAEMEKELEDMTIELRRAQDDANREMQKVQGERFGEIEQAVLPIIASAVPSR